jgi:hypothetical protein
LRRDVKGARSTNVSRSSSQTFTLPRGY